MPWKISNPKDRFEIVSHKDSGDNRILLPAMRTAWPQYSVLPDVYRAEIQEITRGNYSSPDRKWFKVNPKKEEEKLGCVLGLTALNKDSPASSLLNAFRLESPLCWVSFFLKNKEEQFGNPSSYKGIWTPLVLWDKHLGVIGVLKRSAHLLPLIVSLFHES